MKTVEKITYGARGDGYLFRRAESPNWYSAIFIASKESVESTHTSDLKIATRVHKQRLDERSVTRQGKGPFIGPAERRVKVATLLDDLERRYKNRKIKSPMTLRSHLKHVRAYFGGWRAVNVTERAVEQFVEKQQDDGSADASINLRVGLLKAALKHGKVPNIPEWERLEVDNARQGFFEKPEFQAVVAQLPDYLKDVARFGYATGWRKREILTLTWADVDLAGREIRLRSEQSKTGKGRVLVIESDVAEIIERRRQERRLDCATVFHHAGQPIKTFRIAWGGACRRANVQGKLFHDLRRTAARNMVRAGVPERVAMDVLGHRSRSIFDRYTIVPTGDQREAMKKTSAYVSAQPERSNVRPLRAPK
jgi:integrase